MASVMKFATDTDTSHLMWQKIRVCALLLWLLGPVVLHAQKEPSIPVNHSQEFKFSPSARHGSAHITNEFLQLLAEGNYKLRVFTSYQLDAELILNTQKHNDSYRVSVQVHNPVVSGDTGYRDFVLEEHLIPALLDVHFRLKDSLNQTLDQLILKNILWQNSQDTDSAFILPLQQSHQSLDTYLELKKVVFHYPSHDMTRVQQLSGALSFYYGIEDRLNKAWKLLDGLTTERAEDIILQQFRLCETEIIVGHLTTSPHSTRPFLIQNDPLELFPHVHELQNTTQKLRMEFNEAIAQLDQRLYEAGVNLLEQGDSIGAKELLNRAQAHNSLHVPAHIQLARLEVASGAIQQALDRFEKLMGEVAIPGMWRETASQFMAELFALQIDNATRIMDDGRFLDALHMLSKLESFCLNIEQWDCPSLLQEKIKQVHYGMYQSFLSVARRAYTSANYSFALTYIESAREYQQNNRPYLPDDREAMRLMQDVVNGYFNLAEAAFALNDFATADRHLDAGIKLCEQYPQLVCRESITGFAQQVKQKKETADKMTIAYVVTDPRVEPQAMGFDTARKKAADILSRGHLKAWAGEPGQARELLTQTIELALRYDLRKDSIIDQRIISLTQMIKEKECELAHRKLSQQIGSVSRNLQNGFYLEAWQAYQSALEMEKRNTKCSWSFEDTLQSLHFVEHVAIYQEQINKAQRAYFHAGDLGFSRFFEQFMNAQSYHQKYQLDSYGIRHEGLHEFVKKSSNISLMKAAVEHFSDTAEPSKALEMLMLLKENRMDARQVRSLQEYAGKQAATHIFRQKPEIRPGRYAREITGNDAWFRSYVRSFERNWPN